jgi:hypothetical protein
MSERDRELLHFLEDLECHVCTRRYSKGWRCCRRARGGLRRRVHELLAGMR